MEKLEIDYCEVCNVGLYKRPSVSFREMAQHVEFLLGRMSRFTDYDQEVIDRNKHDMEEVLFYWKQMEKVVKEMSGVVARRATYHQRMAEEDLIRAQNDY